MENYAYPTSYPDSSHSSPRSLDTTSATWDDQAQQPQPNPTATAAPKVKFMCSYGGKIQPRPHDNQLSYTGGETKILVVDRGIKFAGLIGRLCTLCDGEVCFKYQLPGEDLDALISVTNDDDLEHMMHEYDRLCRSSSKSARLRLFLFPAHTPSVTPCGSFASSEGRGERERLVEALNSVPPQAAAPPQPPPPAVAPPPANDMDFLFGLEKGVLPNQMQPVVPARAPIQNQDHVDDPIQRHIQDLKRLQIGGQGEDLHRRRSDDNLGGGGGFSGEYYTQKVPENFQQAKMPGGMPANMVGPGGVYPGTVPAPAPEQAVYMIPTQAGMYHTPMGRVPVTGPPGQGYYAVQRMQPDIYRDQQQPYGLVSQVGAQAMAPPQTAVGYSEGFGMVRSTAAGGVGVVDPGYTHVAYDNGMGRPIYYNAPGGVVATSQYPQGVVDMRAAGGVVTNQEGKTVKP